MQNYASFKRMHSIDNINSNPHIPSYDQVLAVMGENTEAKRLNDITSPCVRANISHTVDELDAFLRYKVSAC